MGLSAVFAMSVNAQTSIKISRSTLRSEMGATTSKVKNVNTVAANISCPTQYTAGATHNLNLTLSLTNTDGEYGDSLSITLPAGFMLMSALPSDSIGVSEAPTTTASGCATTAGGTKEPYRGIVGQTVSWGNNDNCWGGMPCGTNAGSTMTITLNVMVGAGVTGPQVASFFVSGDKFPTAAADYAGTFTINPAGAVIVDMKTKLVQPTGITGLNNCALGTQTVIARVVNLSTTPQSNIIANYSINGVTSTSVSIPGPVAVGDSVTFGFPVSYNFNASNMYNIKAWVSQAGDVSLANDTAALDISNTIATALTNTATPYVNGIESAYDYGSINKTWVGTGAPFGLSAGTKHSGAQALFYTIAAGAPTNTYVAMNVLPCVDVVSGDSYKISFWVKSNTSGTLTINGQYGVATGLAQTAAAMTTVLKANTPIVANAQAGAWKKDSVNFTATANETRYFALVGGGAITSASDQINVRFDDIMITKNVVTGIKSISANDAISIFPNPTSGVLNINAVETNSSVEVLNIVGEKVYSNTLVKGNNTIDLSNLANGAYFVKMNSNNQVITKKVVLSK